MLEVEEIDRYIHGMKTVSIDLLGLNRVQPVCDLWH